MRPNDRQWARIDNSGVTTCQTHVARMDSQISVGEAIHRSGKRPVHERAKTTLKSPKTRVLCANVRKPGFIPGVGQLRSTKKQD